MPTVDRASLLPGIPNIFYYVGLSVLATIILLSVSNNTHYYAVVSGQARCWGLFLRFLALNEALRSVFRNFLGMRWFRWLFPGIGIAMIIPAVLRIILLPRPAFSLFTTTVIGLGNCGRIPAIWHIYTVYHPG